MVIRRILRHAVLALALTVLGTGPADAQVSAVLDWIHRLSGPQFVGPNISYAVGNDRVRVRGALAYRWSVASDDAISPDGGITMFSVSPTVEFRVLSQLDLGIGAAAHRYGGDVDGFWHWSIPVYAQGVFPASDRIAVRFGAGANWFFEFEGTDFQPLTVTAPRDGGELVPMIFAGVELHLF
jgi:hypothetical protein